MKVGRYFRTLAVSSLAALALIGASVGGQSSDTSAASAVSTSEVAPAAFIGDVVPRFEWHWWGHRVYYNDWQTKGIVSALAVFTAPEGIPEAIAAFVTPGVENQIASGKCLGMTVYTYSPIAPPTVPFLWDCRVNNGTISKPS